jgi:hypothetical protein
MKLKQSTLSMSKLGMFTALGITTTMLMVPMAANSADLVGAISGGKAKVDVRLRYESVDQEGKDEKAAAITNRTRIGYETAGFMGAKAYFEMENITAVKDDYNDKVNPKTQFPVVADPEGSEVNQVFISYAPVKGSNVVAGRQRIILDGARFVGNVGWRQNEQTYDALKVHSKAITDTVIDYAYVTGVNGILGGESTEMDSHLLNVAYSGLPAGKLTAYTYMLDYDAGTDTQTMGANFSGAMKVSDDVKALYKVEFASMGDYADNDSGNSADYSLIEVGAAVSGVTAKLGMEALGGDGTTSFQTPLATKHKFNGWADKFLGTPASGLVDTYVSAGTKVKGVKLLGVYHTYSSDKGGDDLGSEINLLAATKFSKIFNGGVKYAAYSAGDTGSDISKVWAWVGAKF